MVLLVVDLGGAVRESGVSEIGHVYVLRHGRCVYECKCDLCGVMLVSCAKGGGVVLRKRRRDCAVGGSGGVVARYKDRRRKATRISWSGTRQDTRTRCMDCRMNEGTRSQVSE